MGRGGRGGGHPSFRRPVDLTGVISVAERNDLVTLVSAITEKMHSDINNIFDSPHVRAVDSNDENHSNWSFLAIIHRRRSNKENKPGAVAHSVQDPSGDGSLTYNKAHEIVEKEERQAMTPQLSELRKEALMFFRKWQNAALVAVVGVVPEVVPADEVREAALEPAVEAWPSPSMDRELAKMFAPIPNNLWTLHVEKRKLLLHVVLLLVLSLQDYNANVRVLLLNLTSALNLSLSIYHGEERRISHSLAKTALQYAPADEAGQKTEEHKGPKRWKVGYNSPNPNSTIASALKAMGIGTINDGLVLSVATVAGLLGPLAEYGHLLGNLFGICAVRPTSKLLEACCKDISDFAFLRLCGPGIFEFLDIKEIPVDHRRLRLVLALSGCLSDAEDVVSPWRHLGKQTETYAIRWDVSSLMSLGSALETVIKSTAWAHASKEIKSRSLFGSLLDNSWPVELLKISKIIDNPWSWGMVRAEKVGALLADALVRHKFQGERAVSLIGYSLAARAIYTCLMVLAERRQFGLIDSVVLMGAPAPAESRVWLTLKSVVSGRLINVYSENDYMLGFLYRTSNVHFGVAGLQEIQGANGVENHHVKHLPKGHLSYQAITGQVLRDIGWDDLDVDVIKTDLVQHRGSGRRVVEDVAVECYANRGKWRFTTSDTVT
ncbi:Protein SOK1 [Purpureocillium lavendulum]|uniref:Protein SOK1 n=1 Tax=Purpureocillium lavendulum TaxID=1247861 RepID=A0AB34FRW2_9HYPO|nr:Protein SOK1 [Purpureocillium lavendulum]